MAEFVAPVNEVLVVNAGFGFIGTPVFPFPVTVCETVVDSLIISVVPVAGIFGEPGTLLVVCVSVDGAKGGGTPVLVPLDSKVL